MSSEIAISVSGLGKRYDLGATLSHDTIRDKVTHSAKRLMSRLRRPSSRVTAGPTARDSASSEHSGISDSQPVSISASAGKGLSSFPPKEIWAVKDVSFDVQQGEVIGVIGRNGAGKSTLLKLLSQITEPTEGEIRLRGRVGSLLEVGTGMHPELTGKENIYLNGSVLGMSKEVIDSKYEEIVSFSGIPNFMDTPIKRYSSGMRVRLGFAIAAHLEPEILIIDEVLAVGDLNFQKKCLGKMEDVAGAGRTVLFVSHRMEAIRALCGRTILLDDGRVAADGPTSETVQEYYRLLRSLEVAKDTAIGDRKRRRGSGRVRFTGIRITDSGGRETNDFDMCEDVCFVLDYEVSKPIESLFLMVGLRSGRTRVMVTTSERHVVSDGPLAAGHAGTVRLILGRSQLRPGEYPLYFGLADREHQAYDVVDDLTPPLIITTTETSEDLGFEPSRPIGYFGIDSRLEMHT